MKSIESTQVDAYVQQVCSDRALSPAERAQHAAAAISVHVMQEAGLLLNTPLPIEDGLIELHEEHLEAKAERSMNHLYEKSYEAFEFIEDAFPEYAGAGILYIPETLTFNDAEWPAGPIVMPTIVKGNPPEHHWDGVLEGDAREIAEQARFDKFWKEGESE